MEFRSSGQLAVDIREWDQVLPRFDIIVGVPRSGMLPASMLALRQNTLLMSLNELIAGLSPTGGSRSEGLPIRWDRMLILDDSIDSGRAMATVKSNVDALGLSGRVEFGAVYASGSRASRLVDHVHSVVRRPRMFEWNVLHHPALKDACMDIDGVLCPDPLSGQNDDGDEYLRFLSDAPCIYKPPVRVAKLVTGRLEKYRSVTVDWLNKNEIAYGDLIMLDGVSAEERRLSRCVPRFKAGVYRASYSSIFVESSSLEASEIASLSGRAVFSVEHFLMFYPGRSEAQLASLAQGSAPRRVRVRNAIKDFRFELSRKFTN